MQQGTSPLRIAMCGASEPTPQQAALAHTVGELLAQQGAIVLCGGLGGVMEAVCRGAQQAGGFTVGILPGSDARTANQFVTLPIATGMSEARNVIIIHSAQAVIAIGGGWGTLSEIAFARRAGLAVFGLDTWATANNTSLVNIVNTPHEAVERAIQAARARR